jgi:hypothetical protein
VGFAACWREELLASSAMPARGHPRPASQAMRRIETSDPACCGTWIRGISPALIPGALQPGADSQRARVVKSRSGSTGLATKSFMPVQAALPVLVEGVGRHGDDGRGPVVGQGADQAVASRPPISGICMSIRIRA